MGEEKTGMELTDELRQEFGLLFEQAAAISLSFPDKDPVVGAAAAGEVFLNTLKPWSEEKKKVFSEYVQNERTEEEREFYLVSLEAFRKRRRLEQAEKS